MRVDKFLKNSRIIKRRQVAKEACENERVLINGSIAKASSTIDKGDIIEVIFGNNKLKVIVLNIIDGAKKSDASEMYEVVDG